MALVAYPEGSPYRKDGTAVFAGVDIISLILRQKAHDNVFRTLPLLFQPLCVAVLTHAGGELVIEIQQLVKGLIAHKAYAVAHGEGWKMQADVRGVGLAVIQP